MSESNLQANPYQPPTGVDDQDRAKETSTIGAICFWIGVVCWTIGFLSVFARNSPPLGWFLIATGLSVVAIVFCRKRYRVMAVILLILCVFSGTVATLTHYRRLETLRARESARAAEAAEIAEYEALMTRAAEQTP